MGSALSVSIPITTKGNLWILPVRAELELVWLTPRMTRGVACSVFYEERNEMGSYHHSHLFFFKKHSRKKMPTQSKMKENKNLKQLNR